ncbi:MAG: polysaccharide deacetylase family protein [Planctomycetes bacterium]|nr:polysaccharide deacetylase family protein [Planctomycetota bacterium]
MKHKIKIVMRRWLARVLHATGLRAAFRGSRQGIPVLMFHCVGSPASTDYLPGHMKISEGKLRKLLALLARSGYSTRTVSDVLADLEGEALPADRVALTFDDGYRDNHDVLLPILQEQGATATIYVQTGPMKGRLNWLHHYFWVLHAQGPHALAELLAQQLGKEHQRADLRSLPPDPTAAEYEMKRFLKYEVTPEDRDRVLARIFSDLGGDDAELARAVYLGPDECRALDKAGVELGAHTVNHLILSSLDATRQRLEIEGSLRDLESWLGHGVQTFAYPYGRTWDFNEATLQILAELGFRGALTAMPGLNDRGTPRFELRRLAVNEDSDLADVMCEVDGVFAWFARRGLNLAV